MNTQISSLLQVLRYALADHRSLVRSIDEFYEKLLLEQLALIPKSKSSTIDATAYILKCVFSSIDFASLATSLAKYDGIVKVQIDFEKLCLNFIDNNIPDSESKTRAYLRGLVKNLKPIFNCLNKIIEAPANFSSKIATYFQNDESAHIFD